MRILIITHHRSGGMSLLDWIARELSLLSFHEPFESQNPEIIKKVWESSHMITKVFPDNLIKFGVDVEKLLSTFDKVIVHRRLDKLDTAISNAHFDEDSHINAHETYTLDDDWAERNKDKVERELKILVELHKGLDKFEGIGISTTYEGVYNTGKDVERLKEYLNINEPKHLNVLDSKRRLRNGTIGMEGI